MKPTEQNNCNQGQSNLETPAFIRTFTTSKKANAVCVGCKKDLD